jgi:hypothetical protein
MRSFFAVTGYTSTDEFTYMVDVYAPVRLRQKRPVVVAYLKTRQLSLLIPLNAQLRIPPGR